MLIYYVSFLLLSLLYQINNVTSKKYNTYIVHLNPSHKSSDFESDELWHNSIINSLTNSDDRKNTILYSYNHVINGLSVRLMPSQLSELETSIAHVTTYREAYGKLLTTHTPKFLGLNRRTGLWPAASYGEGMIIGVIDTGIWPESESFHDKGMPRVPQRWKGKYDNITFLCNRKIIGARSFMKGIMAETNESIDPSPRDLQGHGTHVSSTAAGSYVFRASSFGYAKGTAKGVAPKAHLAMYKVAIELDSVTSDVLVAMDQAISDGVDVLSLSLGFDATKYFNDVIAIGAFSAMKKGISVVCAAGNSRVPYSIYNGAPWITTVGGGTIDRSFFGKVTLGNGTSVEGLTYFPESVYITNTPIYYGKDYANKSYCRGLVESEVANKVVMCDANNETTILNIIDEISRAGGIAGILIGDSMEIEDVYFLFPLLVFPISLGKSLKDYVLDTNDAMVKLMTFQHTSVGKIRAPQVASFSSRGPDPINPHILKPDVIAPGDYVVAAVSPNRPRMYAGIYALATDYVLYSGTSMATPHVAGVMALIRSVHPEWSPAAVRSAIMTTSYTIDNTGVQMKDQTTSLAATPLDFGSGHINPNKAMDPGLVYDISQDDYIHFLCGLGYDDQQMRTIITEGKWRCDVEKNELNYPSFMFIANKTTSLVTKNFSRVVTNMGSDNSIYKVFLKPSTGMMIKVEPSTLVFTRKNEKREFFVNIEINNKDRSNITYGYLKWMDQYQHEVSSPIMVLNY